MLQGDLVDIRGLQTVNRALREVAPDLRRQLFRDIGSMVKGRVEMGRVAAMATQTYGRATGALPGGMYLTKAGSKKDIGGGGRRGLFSFVAISKAPHSSILSYVGASGSALATTLNARYGEKPRFMAGAFLGPGSGGGDMWAESREIIERYIDELNARIETAAV